MNCDAADCSNTATKETTLTKSGAKIYLCEECYTRFARRGLLRATGMIIEAKAIN